MKKTVAAALVLILLISGCQNKEKPQPTEDGMLPAPEEQVINNELPGIDLASAKLQITQTAPIRIASETVRLSISEETLDGCTMDAGEEAKKAGPVSYTHLDVYKRQMQNMRNLRMHRNP